MAPAAKKKTVTTTTTTTWSSVFVFDVWKSDFEYILA
jgi:hypothetical protein